MHRELIRSLKATDIQLCWLGQFRHSNQVRLLNQLSPLSLLLNRADSYREAKRTAILPVVIRRDVMRLAVMDILTAPITPGCQAMCRPVAKLTGLSRLAPSFTIRSKCGVCQTVSGWACWGPTCYLMFIRIFASESELMVP